ncbi:DUF2231 domain-containing protein [Amycolatopsis samaneae]|uniref:DUF2231 domain-containing protein n=1 Tax=Amycolatopsis samaneae TaxID=664691 RepID=A0ABW5GRC7_9PSEU
MPVFITGLPLHVLVVHAVVVLVPLAVLASIVVAAWPAARRRYGWPAVGFALVATALIPIATGSGEDLRDRLVPTDLIRQHAHLGDQLLVFVAALFVLVTALVGFDHHRRRLAEKASVEQSEPVPARGRKAVVVVLAVLTVGFGATSAVQVVRIGDSGARAAWARTQYVAPQPHHRNG